MSNGRINNNGDEKWTRRTPSCGETIHRELSLSKEDGCLSDDAEDCNREYYLYLPSIVCDETNDHHQDEVLPIVFVIHCYGCTAERMEHWEDVAQEYKFALIRPEGLQRSWNARYCCGYALHNNVNDMAFFQAILQDLWWNNNGGVASLPSSVQLSKQAVYAMGWSNGGYMVTYAARLFRAIAPVAGYQYEDIASLIVADPSSSSSAEENDNNNKNNDGVGLFMHHALDDKNVRYTGCCSDPSKPPCCCGIDEDSPQQCTSAMTFYLEWAKEVNGCSNKEETKDTDIDLKNDDVTCYTAPSCKANTTICVYQTAGHFNVPNHQEGFPMVQQVADFFMRDACQLQNSKNIWSSEKKECTCAGSSGSSGTYCLVDSTDIKDGHQEEQTTATMTKQQPLTDDISDNGFSFMGVMAATTSFVFLVVAYIYWTRWKDRRWKYGASYRKTSSIELSSAT